MIIPDHELSRVSKGTHNITRDQYRDRAAEFCPRGSSVKGSKLTESDVLLILSLFKDREEMDRKRKQLTNKSIADKFGVHYRTIEKISQSKSWTHL